MSMSPRPRATTPDTTLDAIAAQVRANPPLSDDDVDALVEDARRSPRGPATETLIRHHLSIALDGALARSGSGVEVGDLYQEGTVAVVTAIGEYVERTGMPGPRGSLQSYVSRVVALHLDAAVERENAQRESDAAFVRDTQLYEAAEQLLKRDLGRPPTQTEVAAVLQWSEERAQVIGQMLEDARSLYDEEIAQYVEALEALDEDDDADDPAETD